MRSFGNKPRTQRDKAIAICNRLILARGDRVDALIEGHTAETFAKAHGVSYLAVRSTFDEAVRRRREDG